MGLNRFSFHLTLFPLVIGLGWLRLPLAMRAPAPPPSESRAGRYEAKVRDSTFNESSPCGMPPRDERVRRPQWEVDCLW